MKPYHVQTQFPHECDHYVYQKCTNKINLKNNKIKQIILSLNKKIKNFVIAAES